MDKEEQLYLQKEKLEKEIKGVLRGAATADKITQLTQLNMDYYNITCEIDELSCTEEWRPATGTYYFKDDAAIRQAFK